MSQMRCICKPLSNILEGWNHGVEKGPGVSIDIATRTCSCIANMFICFLHRVHVLSRCSKPFCYFLWALRQVLSRSRKRLSFLSLSLAYSIVSGQVLLDQANAMDLQTQWIYTPFHYQQIWQTLRKSGKFRTKLANFVSFHNFGFTPPFSTPSFVRFQKRRKRMTTTATIYARRDLPWQEALRQTPVADVLRIFAFFFVFPDFCVFLRIFTDFCEFLRNFQIFTEFCWFFSDFYVFLRTFLMNFAEFCGMLRNFADFFWCLRIFADFCGILRKFCGILRIFTEFCGKKRRRSPATSAANK